MKAFFYTPAYQVACEALEAEGWTTRDLEAGDGTGYTVVKRSGPCSVSHLVTTRSAFEALVEELTGQRVWIGV
jgi:hypothetical protein